MQCENGTRASRIRAASTSASPLSCLRYYGFSSVLSGNLLSSVGPKLSYRYVFGFPRKPAATCWYVYESASCGAQGAGAHGERAGSMASKVDP